MIGLAAIAIAAWLGWRQHSWRWPFGIWLALLPLAALQLAAAASWRHEAGLAARAWPDLAAGLSLQLVLILAAYWLGRGVAHITRR